MAAGVVLLGALIGFLLVSPTWGRLWGSLARTNQQDDPTNTAKRGDTDAAEALKRKHRNAPASLRTALNALKKFQARAEIGQNITQYSEGLGETWGQVKIVVEASEGREYEEVAKRFRLAVTCYQAAHTSWELSNAYGRGCAQAAASLNMSGDYTITISRDPEVFPNIPAKKRVAALESAISPLKADTEDVALVRSIDDNLSLLRLTPEETDPRRGTDEMLRNKLGNFGGNCKRLMQSLWNAAEFHIGKADELLNP